MAKFGLFSPNSAIPVHEYEGEFIEHSGESVTVMKSKASNGFVKKIHVAAIHLERGWSVKQIED